MPGVSCVIPEEDLLKCGKQASHVLKLASRQPRESRLAGPWNCSKIPVSTGTRKRLATKKPGLKANRWRRLDNVAVAHLYDAPAHRGRLRIVSDHDDGLIEPVI